MSEISIFHSDYIQFGEYWFFPSTIYPNKKIHVKDILEVDLTQSPPTLRIKKELIFISAEFLDTLKTFVDNNNIKVMERVDIWDIILMPFLDTEFNKNLDKKLLAKLKEYGLNATTVQEWRNRVKETMISYNAIFWDWVHLGQYDLYMAYIGELNKEVFYKFYWETMEVALLAYKD